MDLAQQRPPWCAPNTRMYAPQNNSQARPCCTPIALQLSEVKLCVRQGVSRARVGGRVTCVYVSAFEPAWAHGILWGGRDPHTNAHLLRRQKTVESFLRQLSFLFLCFSWTHLLGDRWYAVPGVNYRHHTLRSRQTHIHPSGQLKVCVHASPKASRRERLAQWKRYLGTRQSTIFSSAAPRRKQGGVQLAPHCENFLDNSRFFINV